MFWRHAHETYHMGFRGQVRKSTLANANDAHDWRIYADFAQVLVAQARPLYATEPMGVELDKNLYALDSSTIDLCLSPFPWARFRRHKAAVKMRTLLDLRSNIPTFIHITDGKVHDVNVLDLILPEDGAFYVMDRGYTDFERLYRLTLESAFFVVRTKSNVLLQWRYSHPVNKETRVRSDQTVVLASFESASVYPDVLRTNYRQGEDLYLYHTRATPECARSLFLNYAGMTNDLFNHPQWYNAITHNCTTEIFTFKTMKHQPHDWRILLNGKADQMEYEQGELAGDLPFSDLKQRAYINPVARAADKDPRFSAKIREGRPGFSNAIE
jgi:hypothetical protein